MNHIPNTFGILRKEQSTLIVRNGDDFIEEVPFSQNCGMDMFLIFAIQKEKQKYIHKEIKV